jgi:hypothetical protein
MWDCALMIKFLKEVESIETENTLSMESYIQTTIKIKEDEKLNSNVSNN